MSKLQRTRFDWLVAIGAVVAISVAGVVTAQGPSRLSSFSGGPVAGPLTGNLPPVARGPMTVTPRSPEALSVLSFDDGTCEGGLGAGVTVTALVNFDVPTQCIQAGLDIVGLTARMNTFNANAFAFGQAGATPPAVGAVSTIPITPIAGVGPCPAAGGFVTRAIGPGAAIIAGTSNFFAGHVNTGFAGRDSSSPPAGRIWLNCGVCGMTQYSPTALAGLGLGGNWMIRVTVEDQNCVPVELMGFSIVDG